MSSTQRQAAIVTATSIAAGSVVYTALACRRFAKALAGSSVESQSDRELRRRSAALQRHLKANPQDLFAGDLLNDIDTEIIARAA